MKLLWDFIEIAATLFENIIILWGLTRIFQSKFSGKNQIISVLTCIFAINIYDIVIRNFTGFDGLFSFIAIAMYFAYAVFALKGKPLYKLIVIVAMFAFIFIINIATTFIISLFTDSGYTVLLTASDAYRLLTLFTTKFLFFLTVRLMVTLYKREDLELHLTENIAAIVIFVLTLVIGITVLNFQLGSGNSQSLTLTLVVSIILINFFVFYMLQKISRDNKRKLLISLLEIQVKEQKTMLEDIANIGSEIKKAEHDIKHHLSSVAGLIENEESIEALTYIKKLLHSYESNIFKYIFVDNSIVNSILNFKIGRCRKSGIDIKIDIETDFEGFSEIDLCVLISNLLDNAIEASESTRSPQIFLTIKNENNYLYLSVKNRIEKSVLDVNDTLKTTKKDGGNHGFGLYSVSQVIEKYDGMKKIYEENGCFSVDIWLKFSKTV
ncbi:MAG: GHKL domain-containing protein [Ruminococcus sp.]|jgi:sensor histidine kinase YesM|nr:GHKL domain-containing protein [Ruminococcus sp.]